ncbi:uncharacterized protein LOC129805912 [Phlebotomus papatasi]|uniref:uncharacterized protein LOC129805912 n=1 Tax=Phlebotomus papatasi TaxID=29031 RepID=UPI0024838493|nr:uncharacterized protein LOC129805912 [Phlebotomus papatasi]
MEVERNLKGTEADETEVEFAIVNSAEVKRANRVALEALLEGFGKESLVTTFLNHDINLRNISLLTNEDLELLGVDNEDVRAEMLREFASQPNQVTGYDEMIQKIDQETYTTNSMRNIISHLQNLQSSVLASHLKLYLENPNDIPIGDHAFASTYVIKALNEITKNAQEMDSELIKIQEDYNRMNVPKKKSGHHLRAFGGFIGAILGGYFLYKLATSRANLTKLTEYLQPFLENQIVPQSW